MSHSKLWPSGLESRREFLGLAAKGVIAATAARGIVHQTLSKKPPFELGLVTYNVAKDWDLATILKICRAAEIRAVECRTTHKHGVEPSLSASDRRGIRKQFEDSGVQFWGCGSTCEFHAAEAATVQKNIDECRRFVDLVQDLGGRGVKVRPNGVAKGMTVEAACRQIAKALLRCAEHAAAANVEIWVEVHGTTTALPIHMQRIMDECPHPAVGVTWNSNSTDLIKGSLDDGFERLKSRIRSCHINDLANDAKGIYPYKALFEKLRKIGYDRYTLIEVGQAVRPEEGEAYLKKYRETWLKLVEG